MNATPRPQRNPQGKDEVLVVVLFSLGVLGLLLVALLQDFSPVKLSVLFFLVFYALALAVHEAAHAVVAAAVGWRVECVVIGMGRAWLQFSLGETVVELRSIPVEGFVRPWPRNLRWPRVKNALIYAAGPLAPVLVVLPMAALLGWNRLFTPSDHLGVIAIQTAALVVGLQAILNLVPHAVDTPEGNVANDGLGIVRSFLLPAEYYAELVRFANERRGSP